VLAPTQQVFVINGPDLGGTSGKDAPWVGGRGRGAARALFDLDCVCLWSCQVSSCTIYDFDFDLRPFFAYMSVCLFLVCLFERSGRLSRLLRASVVHHHGVCSCSCRTTICLFDRAAILHSKTFNCTLPDPIRTSLLYATETRKVCTFPQSRSRRAMINNSSRHSPTMSRHVTSPHER
jgi:hypothetical protein